MGKELRDWYAKHGICVACGQADAAPHRKLCWECLYKSNERKCKYRANMTEEQKQSERKKDAERIKKRYAERKAAGKCVRCGKKPAEPGKVMCTMCRKKTQKGKWKRIEKMGLYQDICLATAITVQPVANILIMAKSSVMSAIVTPYMQWRLHEGKQKADLEVIGLCLVKREGRHEHEQNQRHANPTNCHDTAGCWCSSGLFVA